MDSVQPPPLPKSSPPPLPHSPQKPPPLPKDQRLREKKFDRAVEKTKSEDENVADILGDEDISLDDLPKSRPARPSFPWTIFVLAIIKDAIDILTASTFAWLVSIIIAGILFLWQWRKIGLVRKKMLRWAIRRMIGAAVIDSIPVISLVPWSSLFVLWAHYREAKVVRAINWLMDEFAKIETGGLAPKESQWEEAA